MKKNLKLNLACISLASGILISSVTSYGGILPSESKHWGIKSMERLISEGVFKGYSDGSFKPDRAITKAEFITMVNNMYGFKEESNSEILLVKPDTWYSKEIKKASNKDYLNLMSMENFNPNDNISREEAIGVLGYLLDSKDNKPANLKDRQAISPKLVTYVNSFANSNFINGYEDGSFKPKAGLTRAEMASVTSKAVAKIYNQPGTYQANIDGNIIINSSGVNLKNSKINGNVYIGGDLGPNDVNIKNTSISGSLIIHGDNANSIRLEDSNIKEVSLLNNFQISRVKANIVGYDKTEKKDEKKSKSKGKSSGTSSSGSSSNNSSNSDSNDDSSSPSMEPNIINRKDSQIITIEDVVYAIIVLDKGSLDDYDFYIDNEKQTLEKVNSAGTILKYELNKKNKLNLKLENSKVKDNFTLYVK